MDLSTITPTDFKCQFVRDFPYLPVWKPGKNYKIGDVVYYSVNQTFYVSKVNTNTAVPTNATNWDVDATYSTDDFIGDADICRAFAEAGVNFNQALWGADNVIKLGYLYITAHYLVMDLRASASGISANPQFMVTDRKVGNVSESYGIPPAFLNNPAFAYLATTPYGLKYMSMVAPRLVGNFNSVFGGTNP